MAIHLQLLQESFQALTPVASDVIDHFYATLLKNSPRTATHFRAAPDDAMKDEILQTFAHIFNNLEQEAQLTPYLEALGARCPIQESEFSDISDALFHTFKYFFDATWSQELEKSWKGVLQLIAGAMLRGAPKRGAPAPVSDEEIKSEIEQTLRNLIRESLASIVREPHMQEYAAEQAKTLIKESMQNKLDSLRSRFKAGSAA